MAGANAIDLDVNYSFLGDGVFRLESYQDGVNVNRNASDYSRQTRNVTNKSVIRIPLSAGGGWIGRLSPVAP